METLNVIPQLHNTSAKLSDKNPNSLSHPIEHTTDFGRLLRRDILSDEMDERTEDTDMPENPETENQEEGKTASMPLQVGIQYTVLVHTVFAQQIQKTDSSRLLKAEIPEMTGDEAADDKDGTSVIDAHAMRAKNKITVASHDEKLFASDTGTLAKNIKTDKDDTVKAPHNKPAVMRALSSDTVNTIFDKTGMAKVLKIGDRIPLKADSAVTSQQSRIEGLEVVQSKKSGDLRILHLKLMPENLGSVEVRMRMTANGLHIELQAERTETARLLASDHGMLAQVLEKSGFQDHNRISVTVIDRAVHNTVHAGSAATQTGDQAFGGDHHQGGQEAKPDSQMFGQGGRRFSNDSQKGFPMTDHKPDDLTGGDNAFHNSHRLII